MHVFLNRGYGLHGYLFQTVIREATNLVFLFMVLSAFSMCCGYFEKISTGTVSIEEFYKKRYAKIWPFFAALCLLDLVISPSREALYEVFANLTLCFGLLDKSISVIGVGWFLGVVFLFYMIFPFFCFLLSKRSRAWFSFITAVLFNVLCAEYFGIGRTNILYCAMFFLAGGLLYLYRKPLAEFAARRRWMLLGLCIAATVLYFLIKRSAVTMLILSVMYVIPALGVRSRGILINPVTRFLSGISMELYLCHMVFYRVLEKLNAVHLFSNELASFVTTLAGTLGGAILFSCAFQKIIGRLSRRIHEK